MGRRHGPIRRHGTARHTAAAGQRDGAAGWEPRALRGGFGEGVRGWADGSYRGSAAVEGDGREVVEGARGGLVDAQGADQGDGHRGTGPHGAVVDLDGSG